MLERILFFRQLAVALKSGLPLERALHIQSTHAKKKKFQAALEGTLREVRRGKSFYEALALITKKHGFFQPTDLALVKVGERSGQLPQTLELLAGQLEDAYKLNRVMAGGCIYPIGLLYLSILLLPARFLFQPNGLMPYLFEIFPGLFWTTTLLFLFFGGLKHPPTMGVLYRLFVGIPFLGKQLRKVFLIRFATLLGLSHRAGMDAAGALRLAGETTPDPGIKLASTFASMAAERGKSVSEALGRYRRIFPETFLELYQTGEECGTLDEMLLKQAQIWDDELRPALKGLMDITVRIGFMLIMILIASQVASQIRLQNQETEKQINELLK